MIGADLNALVNCDIVHNVNPPPDPKLFPKGINEDWIKPGRCIFMYLDGGDRTVEGNKEFARLAQQMGFEYNILEGFWKNWPESPVEGGRGLLARTRREDPALDLQRRF